MNEVKTRSVQRKCLEKSFDFTIIYSFIEWVSNTVRYITSNSSNRYQILECGINAEYELYK